MPRFGSRQLFPTLQWDVYANHAAIGPLPEPVRRATREILDAQATLGVDFVMPAMEAVEAVRQLTGRLLGADPAGVAWTHNTSDGVLAVAHGLPWRPRDRVVVFEGEFPTNVTPWEIAARLYDLELVRVPIDGFHDGSGAGLDRLEAALAPGARLVAVSAVQFQTGLRMPLRAIADLAHAAGAQLFVDAIQAVGACPIDLAQDGVDWLTTGGHKWLMAPAGTGLLVAAPERWAELVPRRASWLSHEDALVFLHTPDVLAETRPLRTGPAALEGGMAPLAALSGLAAALELALDADPARVLAHASAWNDAVEPALVARGFRSARATDPAARSPLLCLRPPVGHDAAALVGALAERGVSAASPDGHLRLSPSWPNRLEEAETVVAALDEALTP